MRFSILLQVAVFFTILTLGLARTAEAYLDPGTGSYVLQLVIAALLGALFALKMFWLRIRTFFANLISKKPKDD